MKKESTALAQKKALRKTDVLSSKNYDFGSTKDYKRGDVVVWRGTEPCIGRIKSKDNSGVQDDCWVICDSHNSLHYSNLRYAKPEEIAQLGRKRIILIA